MNIQNFVRNIFKSNASKLSDFRALVDEFEGENLSMTHISQERARLLGVQEQARQTLQRTFDLEDVRRFASATRALEDFQLAANFCGAVFGGNMFSRQSTPRVRATCKAALQAAKDVLSGKIEELQRADAVHFSKLGLDADVAGASAPVVHLQSLIARIENALYTVEADGFSWPDVRNLLGELSANGV